MRTWKRWGAVGLPAVVAVALVGLSPAAAARSAGGPVGRRPVVAPDPSGFEKSDSILSTRLSRLAQPALRAQSASERSAAVGLVPSGPGSLLMHDGRYVVDITVDDPSTTTQQALVAAGATIDTVQVAKKVITAYVAPESLVAVGRVAGVKGVHEEFTPRTSGLSSATSQAVRQAAASDPVALQAGCAPIKSEGDAQLLANTARTNYGLDGAGVKVGVLSDSFNVKGGAAAGVANGELPGPGNPCGHGTAVQNLAEGPAGSADEGRGMSEIVHDLAPESPLAFASAFNSEASFANNIRSLAANGAKVIVDDVTYFDEPMYQDGDVAKAVNDVTAAGVTYFSSAGNENVKDGSNRDIGSYEAGAYRSTGCPVVNNFDFAAQGYLDCHDFDPTGGTSNGDTLTVSGHGSFTLAMGWNQPEYLANTDYDVFAVDATTNLIVASSQVTQDNINDGNPDDSGRYIPSEIMGFANPNPTAHNYRIVVARFSGATLPKFKFVLFTQAVTAAQFNTNNLGDVIGPTVFGHNAAAAAGTIAAVPFNNSATVESYSSRGPATYCWAPVTGTTAPAAAQACVSKNLDVAATDGGRTSFFTPAGPGLFRFFGTSAAAPHAAAVAALMLDARPCATPAQILAAERASGRPLVGFDMGVVGSGLLDANAAVGALATCPPVTGAKYHPVNPTRILESRNIVGNTGGFTTPWGPQVSRSVDVTNTNGSGVPDTGVSAVVLNVTVTGTTAASFLSVFPNGEAVPTASNLNWPVGTTIANLVTVKVGTGGRVSFYNQNGNADVIADVVGWYDTDASANVAGGTLYNPVTPTRILESRNIVGNTGGYTTPWGAGDTRTVDVVGATQHPVPAGATAVVLNVTEVGATVPGFLTVFPADVGTVPTASNVNWKAGQIIPNLVTVRLGTGDASTLGKIKIFNAVGAVDVVADVVGYYADTGAAFHALSPTRILESRFADANLAGTWSAGQTRSLDVTDTHGSGVPSGGLVQGVIMNVTVTGTDDAGFLTLFPASETTPPNASNLNWSLGDTIPNLTITKVPTTGNDNVKIFNQRGTTFVIADVVGWFG